MGLDVNSIRKDFPILEKKIYGKQLVYLDNAATTQKPSCVVEKICEGYYNCNANIHRGVHFLSQHATEAHEAARENVRAFINAPSNKEIIFTRGTTEAINLVASSFGDSQCEEGDEIIVSQMEHHSNIVPWQLLRSRKGIVLKVIPFDENGELQLEKLDSLITNRTKLISVTHVSNTLATINPVKEIIKKAHEHNIPVLVDGAQSIPHLKVEVQDLDADFFVFSGHKVYGPTGIGVLYGKEKWLELIPPYQGGGEMIQKVTFEKTTFNELPFKFEAGTPDYIGSTALSTALDYVTALGMDNIAQHESELLEYAREQMAKIEGMRFIGNASHRGGLVSFLVGDIHPYDMGSILDKLGIAVRTGHHCAEPVMQAFGIEGTVRASFALYNTKEEIDILVAGIERARKMFHH
ncbi:MAG TPA: cysteine desulfurase [Paludibacteraceae bacterium]|nr:cysteine desulfurase [Paludibacteraceae bacterium]HOU67641.1 cysteine desulfurase [Paludibacteraceae bacterium]HPH62484.1 cysteine desulfurase [Paludibacteraceae bacterium]HQF49655.1 cysteine desulfurase [Paludibacteraceae bacterium]HQJ90453.1 cysteine desulfurase [Paludibacteraceae bacterium]